MLYSLSEGHDCVFEKNNALRKASGLIVDDLFLKPVVFAIDSSRSDDTNWLTYSEKSLIFLFKIDFPLFS